MEQDDFWHWFKARFSNLKHKSCFRGSSGTPGCNCEIQDRPKKSRTIGHFKLSKKLSTMPSIMKMHFHAKHSGLSSLRMWISLLNKLTGQKVSLRRLFFMLICFYYSIREIMLLGRAAIEWLCSVPCDHMTPASSSPLGPSLVLAWHTYMLFEKKEFGGYPRPIESLVHCQTTF